MYNCPPIKDVLNFMETFHALDAFVYGTCAEDNLFGCDPANHWTIQVGYSESAPDIGINYQAKINRRIL